MITLVRIALKEHWCPEKIADPEFRMNPPGTPVEIISSSMRMGRSYCKGREWAIPMPTAIRLGREIGYDYSHMSSVWICEHLLEMD
jgi:hypothetical protein